MDEDEFSSSIIWNNRLDVKLDDVIISVCYYYCQVKCCYMVNCWYLSMDWSLGLIEAL